MNRRQAETAGRGAARPPRAVAFGALLVSWLSAAGGALADRLVFQDDFSNPGRGWPVNDPSRPAEGALFNYLGDGSYQVTPLVNDGYVVVTPPAAGYGPDVSVEADVFTAATSETGMLGVVCRFQDPRNFYGFVVGVARGYGIVLADDGQYRLLRSGPLSLDPTRAHRVRARCSGSQLTLWVDGRQMAEATDATHATGRTGLVVGADREASATGAFDNFALRELGAGRAGTAETDVRRPPSSTGRPLPPPPDPASRRRLGAGEALVTVEFLDFRYAAVLGRRGTVRVLSERVTAPLDSYNVLINPGDDNYGVTLRSAPNFDSGVAAWDVTIDPATGRHDCSFSPLYDNFGAHIRVYDADGRPMCSL